MRHWRRPLIYFLVVVSVAGFAFYQYKKSEKEKITEEKKALVFSEIQPSEVQSISISQEEGSIYLIRKEQGWWMESPVKDLADRESVESWLDTLLTEKIRVIKEKGVDWTEYDLQDPIRFLEISMKSGKKVKLSISKYSAFDGSFYIRRGEQLLLGETSWAGIVRKKEKDFRSYKLINIDLHPTSLHYESQSFSTYLSWHNYNWSWKKEYKGKKFPLSKPQLESYWSSLSNVYFGKEVYPDTEKLRKKYQLVSPDIQLEMEFDKNKRWSVQVSPEVDGKFYALVSTRDYIFVLNEDQREKILLTEKKLRDHSHPFLFKEDQVQFIEINGYGVDIQVKKNKEKWELSSGNKETIDRKELGNMLRRIRALSAEEYFDPKKSFKSVAHLILKNQEGDTLLKLESGDPFKLKKEDDTKKNEMVYMRSSLSQEIMALRFSDLKPVFSSLIKKSEKKEKDKTENRLKEK